MEAHNEKDLIEAIEIYLKKHSIEPNFETMIAATIGHYIAFSSKEVALDYGTRAELAVTRLEATKLICEKYKK